MNRMMKTLTKTAVAFGFSTLALAVSAQVAVSPVAPVSPPVKNNAFLERAKLTKEYPLSSAITLAWYTGALDSTRDGLSTASLKLLPLSNYVTTQLGRLAVIDIDFSDYAVAQQAALGNVDIVYTSALTASQLVDLGWKPVANRALNLSGVVLMKKSIKIEKPEDLKGKVLTANLTSTVNYMTTYGLNKFGLRTDNGSLKIVANMGSQYDVSKIINNPNVDGAIIRKEVANDIMKKNPDKFYVAYEAPIAPGHTVMVSPNLKPEEVKRIKSALLALNPGDSGYRTVLEGLDGYNIDDKEPFREMTEDQLLVSKDVYSFLKLKPLLIK